jgi:hypothetical protein
VRPAQNGRYWQLVCYREKFVGVDIVRLYTFTHPEIFFLSGPAVLNGASDLIIAIFGDQGRHARTTVGAAALPDSTAVEIEAVFGGRMRGRSSVSEVGSLFSDGDFAVARRGTICLTGTLSALS